jgi:hypothetical protein
MAQEQPGGRAVERPHLPHRLVCTDSDGNKASMIPAIKTQGSDTKLVGQMQPYYEAKGLGPVELAGRRVPPRSLRAGSGWGKTEPEAEPAQHREEPQCGHAGPGDDERGGHGGREQQEDPAHSQVAPWKKRCRPG